MRRGGGGVGDEPSDATQAMHSGGRLVEDLHHLVGQGDPPRCLGREEGPVPVDSLADPSPCMRCEGVWVHDELLANVGFLFREVTKADGQLL